MSTILITGISGFVAGHFTAYLDRHKKDVTSLFCPEWPLLPNPSKLLKKVVFHKLDLLNLDVTRDLIRRVAPDYVLHLASQAAHALLIILEPGRASALLLA